MKKITQTLAWNYIGGRCPAAKVWCYQEALSSVQNGRLPLSVRLPLLNLGDPSPHTPYLGHVIWPWLWLQVQFLSLDKKLFRQHLRFLECFPMLRRHLRALAFSQWPLLILDIPAPIPQNCITLDIPSKADVSSWSWSWHIIITVCTH